MPISKYTFGKELDFEKTLSEYKRVKIFTFILTAGFVIGICNLAFDVLSMQNVFKYKTSIIAIILWLLFFLNYEIIFLFFLKRYVTSRRPISESFKTIHSFIEILFPGVLMFMLTYIEQRPIFLDSPVLFMYFILIAISALQLNFYVSFFMGLLASIQYAFLIYYSFVYVLPNSDIKLSIPASIYLIRAIIMLLTGIASGLIAKEINNRVENSFRQLIEKQKIIGLFGQQVSKEIVDELIKRKDEMDVRKVNATIMFLDIRNFSSYAETKNPAEIIEFQNNIFNPLIEVITKHKGIVNQFMGDGFMASFGVPLETDEHIDNGFNAGLEIIRKINEIGDRGLIPKTRVGIGLHSGEVITGNIGNDIRKQYSIAGTTVIISARLEQLNKQFQTQYLITKDVYEKIKNGKHEFESFGEVAIKGFERPVEVICVKM